MPTDTNDTSPRLAYEAPNAPSRLARTSPLLLIAAWLVVGLPAAWGVTQTVKRSMDLFTSPTAATPTTTQVR